MHNKFEINRTKIKGGCHSGRKVVPYDSKRDLPPVVVPLPKREHTFNGKNILQLKLLEMESQLFLFEKELTYLDIYLIF